MKSAIFLSSLSDNYPALDRKTMKKIFLALLILSVNYIGAQQTVLSDTISQARSLINEKKFEDALQLLSAYNSNNSNLEAMRIHAQLLYWMKKFDEANALYEKTLSLFPDAVSVKLDYGRMLFQLSRFSKARLSLNDYLIFDSTHLETNTMLAYIDLWTGHIAAAKKRAALLERHNPGNGDAAYILQQISIYTAPYIKIGGAVYSDDQPLQSQRFEPEAGFYQSWIFSPFIKASLYSFDADRNYKTSWIEAGNKISFASSKTDLEFSAGYFQANNYSGTMSWKVKLDQKISTALSFDVASQKKPYQYTLNSIKYPFLYQVTEIGLNLDNKKHWLARGAFQNQGFDDGNKVYTAYLWFLAPLIQKNDFSLKAGYSFSYANANQNNFEPKNQSFPPVLNTEVDGIYNPYFTPADQTIHSLLGSLHIPFSKFVSFTSRLNIGISAHASQPSLFVDKKGTGPFFINKKFESYSYTPVEFSSELQLNLSQNFFITGNYIYNSLIFFKSHSANILLKYLFINDKRKK